MVLCTVLLLQKVCPLVHLMLPMGALFRGRVRVKVQDRQGRDTDRRAVMVAEREMVVISRSVWVIAVVEGTAGKGICLATLVRTVKARLLWMRRAIVV